MKRNLRLLVFGGRDYADRAAVFAALDHLHRTRTIVEVIEGGANGADALAGERAELRGVRRTTVPAAWDQHGRRAGPLRNRQMAELGPDAAVQFPGGRGTADMRAVLDEAGVPAWEPLRTESDLSPADPEEE
jgi:hypothetical protein